VNNGKICIPVLGRTAEEMIDQIHRVEGKADVIELRLDYLNDSSEKDLDTIFAHKGETPWLLTFRPKEQGGQRELARKERDAFWRSGRSAEFIDVEEDMVSTVSSHPATKIYSYHDFSAVPDDLSSIYVKLSKLGEGIVKIAAHVDDSTLAAPIWKLLEFSEAVSHPVIPLAMGEAGKWTRILGLAHGAFLTYASLESGSETAPGQISSEEMGDLYRAKDLDKSTDVYGIIAGNTSYTVSPPMQNAAFKANGLNAVFVPFQVKDLDEFMRRMVKPETREVELNLKGFAITNPHKQSIIPHLDEIDETARKVGAVNTVKIENGKLRGSNTDAFGFIEPLKEAFGDLQNARVAVVGAGGASRAVIYALKQEKAEITLLARDPRKARDLKEEFDILLGRMPNDQHPLNSSPTDIIVNTTPLGTKGQQEEATIATARQLEGTKLVYDLVYNPAETRLMNEAKKAGVKAINGLEMIIRQGTQQFEIWTGQKAPIEEMRAAVVKKFFS